MPTTITVLKQQFRSGTDTSSTGTVPTGCVGVQGGLTMSAADQANPSYSVTWVAQTSPDGVTWTPVYGPEVWQGGTIVNKQGQTVPQPTTVEFSVEPNLWGQQVRMVATALTRFSYGATFTVYP